MLRRTAVIDIGSNSARLVIFENTSSYGFHLICEQKSKVRIGEGAYKKDGYLQPIAIKRAFYTLQSFTSTINKYSVTHVKCIATSALLDAPNANIFIDWMEEELGLYIEIITGNTEAMYGAIAAGTLLPLKDGITVDIGGGSSDMALIKNGTIVDTYSLNLGTVRLKELFFDKDLTVDKINKLAKAYITKQLKDLPSHFKHELVIGIGGTIRNLSKSIIRLSQHPLNKLHAFTYNVDLYKNYFSEISYSKIKSLKKFQIKKNRYDTIREGTLIFSEILLAINAKKVITSSVGVREGVYIESMLKNKNLLIYPDNINPSITSILDRFKPHIKIEKYSKNRFDIVTLLYGELQSEIKDDLHYLQEIDYALKLSDIGNTLNIYKSNQTAFYIAMQELNYGFTHKEILLISMLLRMHGKSLLDKTLFEEFKTLLPNKDKLLWLSFIYTLTVYITESSHNANISFIYRDKTLTINSDKELYLIKDKVEILEKPIPFQILIKDNQKVPKNRKLGV